MGTQRRGPLIAMNCGSRGRSDPKTSQAEQLQCLRRRMQYRGPFSVLIDMANPTKRSRSMVRCGPSPARGAIWLPSGAHTPWKGLAVMHGGLLLVEPGAKLTRVDARRIRPLLGLDLSIERLYSEEPHSVPPPSTRLSGTLDLLIGPTCPTSPDAMSSLALSRTVRDLGFLRLS